MKFMTRTRVRLLAAAALIAAVVGFLTLQPRIRAPLDGTPVASPGPASVTSSPLTSVAANPGRAEPAARRWIATIDAVPGQPPVHPDDAFPWRLRNTAGRLNDLMRRDDMILLRSALVDTSGGEPLAIPAHLRSPDGHRLYVVQSRGPLSDAFRQRLAAAGLEVVSYIPNNAYLVAGSRDQAEAMTHVAETAAVLPYEPYFKLDATLLPLAMEQRPLPEGARLLVCLRPTPVAIAEVEQIAGTALNRSRSPFGTLLTLAPPPGALIAIARHPDVQTMEWSRPRRLANDLAGPRVGSSLNETNDVPYLDLTGGGVTVNVNDSGVDEGHIDLAGRVTSADPALLSDPEGHGTHVAAIIAGAGKGKVAVTPQGSFSNSVFRGKAPGARLYALPVHLKLGPEASDEYLQTNAAARRIFLSNNSWNYSGAFDYDSAAASFDAAVRDALPGQSAPQPMLFVFSAGNDGFGGIDGLGGSDDTVSSPATAKNVITVGALESLRQLTNEVVIDTNGVVVLPRNVDTNAPTGTYTTNQVLFNLSDSDHEIASYSSRGNTGVGIEGESGRFKPDVVAPGSFIVSARSRAWKAETGADTNNPIYHATKQAGDEMAKGIASGQQYRYESGTSMAAPAVTGVLALLQELLDGSAVSNRSPALYKALLINGARPVSPAYGINPDESLNYSGWGHVRLTNTIPLGWSNRANINLTTNSPVIFVPEAYSRALSTGQRRDWNLQLREPTNNTSPTLRITLAWTDPPGNPAASTKLVNDLDLVVSNTVTRQTYFGNLFVPNESRSRAVTIDTNAVFSVTYTDPINNVENIVIPNFDTNYVVSVVARRVNVQSLGQYQSGAAALQRIEATLQDFVLVISTGDGDSPGAIGAFTPVSPALPAARDVATVVTNGAPLLEERAGANSPRASSDIGSVFQWHFYTFTNRIGETNIVGNSTNVSGTNVAFVTFLPPNLGVPRDLEGDVDLYVSTNSGLLNLNASALASAWKSVTRGGTEFVVLTNPPSQTNVVYYIGVKSEDQQAVQYGFVAISSDRPFAERLGDGRLLLRGIPLRQPIPDGSSDRPGVGLTMAIGISTFGARTIEAQQSLTHTNYADLLTQVTHGRDFAVLHNHRPYLDWYRNVYVDGGVNVTNIYNDAAFGLRDVYYPADGPGSLDNFLGRIINGVWLHTATDDKFGGTGFVPTFNLIVEENDLTRLRDRTVRPGRCEVEIVDVPPDASRMTVVITNINPALPLQVDIRREAVPNIVDRSVNDKSADVLPPRGTVSIGVRDVPPLQAGRYFIAVCNPNGVAVSYKIRVDIEHDLDPSYGRTFVSDGATLLQDIATLASAVTVDDDRPVSSISVGVRLTNSLTSDLQLSLHDPAGHRAVVFENRGALDSEADFMGGQVVATLAYQHVALTFDGASGVATLYHNATQVAQSQLTNLPAYASWLLTIGTDPGRNRQKAISPVNIDDLGVWQLPLAGGAVRDLFARGLRGIPKSRGLRANGLAYHWPFNGSERPTLGAVTTIDSQALEYVPGILGQALRVAKTNAVLDLPLTFIRDAGGNVLPRFSLDGWIAVDQDSPTNIVVAGRTDSTLVRTNNLLAPVLLVGFPPPLGNGPGSISAVFRDRAGRDQVVRSAAGIVRKSLNVTNDAPIVFTDFTNVTTVPIKFGAPPYDGADPYLPEEEFRPLLGQRGTGDWRLLVKDDRGGGVSGTLQSWELRLTFAPTNIPTTRVVPGVTYSNCLSGDQQMHFLVDVPIEALNATNLFVVTGPGAGDLLYSTSGVPDGDQPDDLFLFQGVSGSKTNVLDTRVAPILPRGQRYYLTVQSSALTSPATTCFQLRVDLGVPIVALRTNTPYDAVSTNLGLIDFYSFNVPTNALQVDFAVTNANTDVTLIARRGRLPSKSLYELISARPGRVDENIVVGLGSEPIRLGPGVWYLGVYPVNASLPIVDPVRYSITARTTFGTATALDPGGPVSRTNTTTAMQYFYIDVPEFPIALSITVSNMTQNVNAVLRRAGPLPTPTSGDYFGANTGLTPERFVILKDSTPVPVQAGRWILGVHAVGTVPAAYTVGVEVQVDDGSIVPLLPDLANQVFTAEPGTNYFSLTLPLDSAAATFDLFDLSGNFDLYARRGSLPRPGAADFANEQAGVTPESITVERRTFPRIAGDWYLAVVQRDPGALQYQVRYSVVLLSTGGAVPTRLLASAPPDTDVVLEWDSIAGRRYLIQYTDRIIDTPAWTDFLTVDAAGSTTQVTLSPGAVPRFFRVLLLP